MAKGAAPKRRSRPLRVEQDDVLLFITSRTVEERFWLHPLLSCAAKPRNRRARRAVAALGRDPRKRYAPRKARTVSDPEQWPGLNLCFRLGDSDELTFEHFDTDAWVCARRPEVLTPFFVPVALTLSPLPASDGRERDAYAADVLRWVADRVREDAAGSDARRGGAQACLGLGKILDANFDQRPKHPKTTRRPYCFGSPQHRVAHYEQMSALHQVYADRSERYRGGQRGVCFPTGTYPPPLIAVAA